MNASEEYVARLCHKLFLSLWSYATPRGKSSGKELCDCLVVCDPDIVIFSVKDIGLLKTRDPRVNWQRWHKRAVDESVGQLYGAARIISTSSSVITEDGDAGLRFPDLSRRRVHFVAVALGGRREGPVKQRDFGKGFVHVFDERSLDIVMSELDTVTDFVRYLLDKEAFARRPTEIIGAEEDILAAYLSMNRTFPENYNLVVFDKGFWAGFSKSPEFHAKKEANPTKLHLGSTDRTSQRRVQRRLPTA